jgi:hypothetical protein
VARKGLMTSQCLLIPSAVIQTGERAQVRICTSCRGPKRFSSRWCRPTPHVTPRKARGEQVSNASYVGHLIRGKVDVTGSTIRDVTTQRKRTPGLSRKESISSSSSRCHPKSGSFILSRKALQAFLYRSSSRRGLLG